MSRIAAMQGAIRLCEAVRELAGDTEKMDATIEQLRAVARDVRYGGEWTGEPEKLAAILDGCGNGACYMCRLNQRAGCRKALKEEAAAAIRQQAKTIESLRAEVERLTAEVDSMRGDAYDSDMIGREPAQWQKDVLAAIDAADDPMPF